MTNGFTMLIVDDEQMTRDLLVTNLQEKRHAYRNAPTEYLTASDGKEALKVIADRRVDMVITDIQMPNMDGIAFYYELRRMNHPAANCCVFMTGHQESYDELYEIIRSSSGTAFYRKGESLNHNVPSFVTTQERLFRMRSHMTTSQTDLSVLVLDDSPIHLELTSERLSKAGLDVIKTTRTDAAANALASHDIAVAIIDRDLRENGTHTEGIEFGQRMKPLYPFTDFILYTSHPSATDLMQRAVQNSFRKYLNKGDDSKTLVSTVNDFFDDSKKRRQAALAGGQGIICYLLGPRAVGKTTAAALASQLPFVTHIRKHSDRPPRPGESQNPLKVDKKFKPYGYFANPAVHKNYFDVYTHPDGYQVGVPRQPLEQAIAEKKIALVSFGTRESFEKMRQSDARHHQHWIIVMSSGAAMLERRDIERERGSVQEGPMQLPYRSAIAQRDIEDFDKLALEYSTMPIYNFDPVSITPQSIQQASERAAAQVIARLCELRRVINTPRPSVVPSMP